MKRNRTLSLTLLPDELIVEILLRLSVRSLLRFKCVSKAWFSLISNPQFAKIHFDLAAVPTHRVLKLLNNLNANSAGIDDDDDSVDVVLNVPSLPSFLPLHALRTEPLERIYKVSIVGSCRGFLLLKITLWDRLGVDLVVWNPSTGNHKRINNNLLLYNRCRYLYGIGYDSSTDDYVVVVVKLEYPCTVVDCFSLRTNSWSFAAAKSTVSYAIYAPIETMDETEGQLLNGALHWNVRYSDGYALILAFDMREKRLLDIPLPPNVQIIYHLRVMGGCLSIFLVADRLLHDGYEMWTMKEYRVQSSWTKSFVFYGPSLHPSLEFFHPLCFTKKGEILGLTNHQDMGLTNYEAKLLITNDKGEVFEHHGKFANISGLMYGTNIYRESLLSFPGDGPQL